MECQWQVEIDSYCRKVLDKHWPNVKKYGDIRTIREGELEAVDLICGGFPCQPVSVAGKRKGKEDERWLWPEFARIIHMVRPRYILVENVPGLLNANNGTAMGEVLGDLAESGYDAEWNVLSAAMFGAPHLRKRVFIIAYPRSEELENRIFKSEFLPSKTKERSWNGYVARSSGDAVGAWGWSAESIFFRVDDGVSAFMDRTEKLGNAVVPQVAEWIGRRILELDAAHGSAV